MKEKRRNGSKAIAPFKNKILQGDCLDILAGLPRESVNLIVTSPPYADNRKSSYEGVPIDGYVDWFLERSAQFQRVLRSDGSFILNVKERTVKGEKGTYILELVLALKDQGWRWTEEYIWHKKNSYPGKWPNRFRDAWERCLHFTKQKSFKMFQESVMVPTGDWAKGRLSRLSQVDRLRAESSAQNGFAKNVSNWVGRDAAYPTNVLHLATECKNRQHSAPFPVSLPAWFIKLFTEDGDIVLDPFIGAGTTAVACHQLDRQFIGIDSNPSYVALARSAVANLKRHPVQR
ncbi:MAG: site-specific DNA-methyltransferase [Chloroflexi bacterium]|nr:site-specific DNA-methyltransferase [Chloroflexota bacterium]